MKQKAKDPQHQVVNKMFILSTINVCGKCSFYLLRFIGLAAGAVDENDFIRAYTDTPTVQVCLHLHFFIVDLNYFCLGK